MLLGLSLPMKRFPAPVVQKQCQWYGVDSEMVSSVMHRYFTVNITSNHSCDLFLIEGVPAAAMLYNQDEDRCVLRAQAFYLNYALLLLFDAGEQMRLQLYRRYNRTLNVQHAANLKEFTQCP